MDIINDDDDGVHLSCEIAKIIIIVMMKIVITIKACMKR